MSPRDAHELAGLLAERFARAEKVSAVDLQQLNRVLELTPEDMTVTVETGISLAALQQQLAAHGQWLPIDPPNPGATSIHELLSRNLSGPRRYGYGTIREHLIGMKVALADGRVIKSGGKVVKNVAGYDLAKLFIGARDSLGIIVEATFKLRPLPETEAFVGLNVPLDRVAKVLRSVQESPVTPVVFDAHRLAHAGDISVVLGFAGTHAEVDWQLGQVRELGFVSPATLEHEAAFWNATDAKRSLSVLPSRLHEAIRDLRDRPFVARAGNGLVHYRGELVGSSGENLPRALMERVKQAYDPKRILPEFTL